MRCKAIPAEGSRRQDSWLPPPGPVTGSLAEPGCFLPPLRSPFTFARQVEALLIREPPVKAAFQVPCIPLTPSLAHRHLDPTKPPCVLSRGRDGVSAAEPCPQHLCFVCTSLWAAIPGATSLVLLRVPRGSELEGANPLRAARPKPFSGETQLFVTKASRSCGSRTWEKRGGASSFCSSFPKH